MEPELRSSSGARPGDRASWRESQACGAGARRLRGQIKIRAAQQLRSPTGRPRLVARKPSLRSRRPAIEGLKINSLSRHSKIYGGVLGNRFQNLWWSARKEVFYAFTRHAGSPDARRAAVAANRLIKISLKSTPAVMVERLAASFPIHGQPELRSSLGARLGNRALWRESIAPPVRICHFP